MSRVPELVHWGGRLLKERAVALLVCNAAVLGGLLALLLHGAARLVRRAPEGAASEPREDYALAPRLSDPPPG